MTIGKQIRKRRKELKMSVDELARRIGKDRSTIYRYENGDIGNMPLELLPPMVEALETTPQELLSSIITNSEWLSHRAECWFDATEGYEFNDEEMKLFYELAKYFMKIRDSEDYHENMNALFTLFKQLNK
jgi:transcriptional regulator with XRE-family HTH domain